MKCKKCGGEIAEGSLYCEKCGEDIHIVPEYDSDEFNLGQAIRSFFQEDDDTEGIYEDVSSEATSQNRKKRKGVGLLILAFLSVIVVLSVFLIRNTYDYQLNRAYEAFENHDFDSAEASCMQAIDRKAYAMEAHILLADVFYACKDFVAYEQKLLSLADEPRYMEVDSESVYSRLITLYKEQNRLVDITLLLNQCKYDHIKEAFSAYVVEAPTVDLTQGTYHGVQVVRLEAAEGNTIYYTLDGSQPGAESAVYNVPIVLENGTHEIRTICTNEQGVPSLTVSYRYDIQVDKLLAPTVFPVSGTYHEPQLIEIEGNTDNIYYTADGSDPNLSSQLYTGPIPVPLGNSKFKFVRIEEDNYSEVETRKYKLELNDAISAVEAEEVVIRHMMEISKINNPEGYVDESGARLIYEYKYVISLTDKGSFYIINESFVDVNGSVQPTGDSYAVDIYAGKLYGLYQDEYFNYELVEIESVS